MFTIPNNPKSKSDTTVFVAMSGGVDSSVVAGMMKEAGYKTIGVTMCFNITHPDSKRPSCCGIDGIEDARRAAQILDIPHYVFNFADVINDSIIENFTSEYLSGRTPNPCVRCNQFLKFGALYDKVMNLGADYLATGHYAKIHFNADTDDYEMKKGEDDRKDQSYFLYSMKKHTLSKVLFPLGDLTKTEVRVLADKYQLNVANKPESQDICFVPDEGYQKFLRDRLGDAAFTPGPFVDEDGETVGEHKGIAFYTIGQRDKLGIALGYPAYVNRIDKKTNTIHVGHAARLYAKGLKANQLNMLMTKIPEESFTVRARIRYNHPEIEAQLSCVDNDHCVVHFDQPERAVTPGQSVVFYDVNRPEVVLGGAIINRSIPCDRDDVTEQVLTAST